MRWEFRERDAQLPPGTVKAKPRAHCWHLEVPCLHPHWISCVPLGNVLSLRFVTWRLKAAASAWWGRGGSGGAVQGSCSLRSVRGVPPPHCGEGAFALDTGCGQ